jgi:translation initiation factor 1
MATSKKKQPLSNGFVFSTDPNFKLDTTDTPEADTLPATDQKLRIKLETKQRGGKAVTLVLGFVGTTSDMEALGKKIKNHCGTGGSVKDGEILIQGDQRDKVLQWLLANNYKQSKKI